MNGLSVGDPGTAIPYPGETFLIMALFLAAAYVAWRLING